jgi:hypothetical protein
MTIWERTLTALTGLGLPLAANAYIVPSSSQLPDEYIVYFLVSAPPELQADDEVKLRFYRMQVSYYSRSGLAGLPGIEAAMVAAGFAAGPLTEIPYNPASRHFGLALEFAYHEEE